MALVDVEITISGARDLKNVNWKHGDLCAYAVAWIDDAGAPPSKVTTRVDRSGDSNPTWDQKFTLTLPRDKLEDACLALEIYHDKAEDPEKAMVGSADLPLLEVVDAGGFDERQEYTLKLKRPSGRPHGKLEIAVRLRERRGAYGTPPPPGTVPYGQPYYGQGGGRDWQGAYPGYNYPYPQSQPGYPNYGQPSYGASTYGAPPQQPYRAGPQPYGAPPQPYAAPSAYGAPPPTDYYNQSAPYAAYSQPAAQPAPQKGSKFGGIGTGLAVGALAGAVGGLALGEYVQHEEKEAAEDQAEEDAERYAELEAARDDDDYGGGDDYGYGDDE